MLATEDREAFVFTVVYGDDSLAMRVGENFELNRSYGIAETIREKRTIEIPDVADTEEYRASQPVYV